MLRAWLAILALHRWALGIATASIVVYALVGFFLVPHLLRTNAQEYVANDLGRSLALGEVSFNPFTFRLAVHDAVLSEKAGDPIASFKQLVVNAELASIWQRAVVLKEVQLDAPDVNLIVDRDASINLARLAPAKSESQPEPAPAAADEPLPRIRIGRLAVNDGRVDFEDRTRPEPFTATLSPIRFALDDFQTDLNHENAYQFAARSSAGETLAWSGSFTAQPLGSHGQFTVGQLRAQTIESYLQGQLPVRLVDGTLSFAGTYQLSLHPTLALDVGLPEVSFENFAAAEQIDAQPIAVVPKLHVAGAQFSFGPRSVRVDKVDIEGARVRASRESDGSLSVARLAKEDSKSEVAPEAAPGDATTPASRPQWNWAVGEIRVADAAFDLEDRSVSPAVQFNVAPIAVTLAGLNSEQGSKVNVTADLGLSGKPLLKSSGQVQLTPLTAALALDLNAFDLSMLQPYVSQATNLTLRSGQLSVKGDVSAAAEEGTPPALTFRGDVQVANLHTIAGPANEDLVKWRNLALSGIDFSHNPDRVTIDRIVARQPYARVIIRQDQTLNVAAALKRNSNDKAEGEPAEGGPQSSPPAKPTPMRIKNITVTGGSALFADYSITPSFATGIVDLEGTITGLSSQPDSRAKVQLKGKVDRYAPVDIAGEVNLLSAAAYSDVALNFRNMELTTFNPYSGKFAGYNISKGKLSTELRYRIQDRKLDAQHHIVVDNLEFGDKTDSKDAAPIPIKLAVALLKDGQGVIDLELPVSGSLDDPKFRLAPIIWKALLGLLTKIATAPFAALGALFGGGDELAYVDFQPGSAELPAAQLEQLDKLARALAQRPQLRLDVPVTLVAEHDSKAIATTNLYARVPPLPDGTDEAALRKRLTQLEALYKTANKIAPEYPAETQTDKSIDWNARISWIEARLLEGMQPEQPTLEALGRQRAQAVQAAVLANTAVAPERLFITTERSASLAKDGRVRMEMKLE
ncbi:MAG TPA: DUF748 domain-containing protein [Steroidobacteraceae bacterium]|nr:DUF748 domain-containing protein [Steroidobacteraceae bacterium]